MFWIFLASSLIIAYLCGSANFAIIVSILTGNADIRTQGNRNAGTANISRSMGKAWGTLVFFGDVGKVVIPLLIAEEIRFSLDTFEGTAGLVLMAAAAITGHKKPLYFGFRGGGGFATTLGAVGFFIPLETFVSMIIGFCIGMVIFKNKEYKIGRWIGIFILLITPPINLIIYLTFDVEVSGRIGLGIQPWYGVVGVAVIVLFAVVANAEHFIASIRGQDVQL
ncbi:MAG: glycerol-3-phosphate acyltransferase [Spirochaetales bacterium]|nr:glycerol-3-phosphate acyltransferase [Spirochaetales bacterium]